MARTDTLEAATKAYMIAVDTEIVGGGSIAAPGTPAQKAACTRASNRMRKFFDTDRDFYAYLAKTINA